MEVTPRKICGRPTKAGTPCQGWIQSNYLLVCVHHQTPEDLELRDRLQAAETAGYNRAIVYTKLDIENELRAEWMNRPCKHMKTTTSDGRQLIVDNRGYTYAWAGAKPLEIGDEVIAPSTPYGSGPQTVTVMHLGTDYQGPVKELIKLA